MPNWCNNVVEITHEDPAMIDRVRKAFNEGALLQEFIPVPQELKDAVADFQVNEALMEKYGYSNWYDFCVNEWGTKWDIGADGYMAEDNSTGLSLTFDSAWSPPIGAYEKLTDLGFAIRAYYYEPGMCYAGIWEDGHDDYYDYSGMDSAQVAEEFPEVLDEMFCISESMAEYEEENAEDDLDDDAPLFVEGEAK